VVRARRGADTEREVEYDEAIRSWRRNPDEEARIDYEVKWEDDEVFTWEQAEMFEGGGKEILEEFQAAEEELQRELAVEMGKKARGRGRPGSGRGKLG
jgi:hypothetical protein